ncbi:MAG: sulfatase family protein [Solirubrobacterales bacterium]
MAATKHHFVGGPTRSAKRRAAAVLVALAGLGTLAFGVGQTATAAGPGSPNIIFILTDDETAQEMTAMPTVMGSLVGNGVSFSRDYDTYPICCPSRATFLTGRYMHNHGVRGNGQPYGGAKHYETLGHEATALPTRLDNAGYYTAHVGKVLNGFGGGAACGEGSEPHVPQGWDEFYGKIAATNGACSENNYFQYSLFQSGPHDPVPQVVDYGSDPTDYQTDVYANNALRVLDEKLPGPDPVYLSVAFGAPHGPFEPAPRHKFTQSAAVLPVLPGFDEKNISDKPSFLRDRALHRLTSNEKLNIADRRHRRLEMLLSVDDAIAQMIGEVATNGELGNTYFIFTSDNGFFFGEHRIGNGKYLPYEPSSRVPLVIRGPGIPTGASSSELVSNVDYMPTVLQIAGTGPASNAPLDGRTLLPFAQNPAARSLRPILLEGDVGPGVGPGQNPDLTGLRQRRNRSRVARLRLNRFQGVDNLDQEPGAERFAINGNVDVPAFRGIRTNRYAFYIYATGETELYDMVKDPAQLTNVATNKRYKKVNKVLSRRLLRLAFCYADACNANVGADPKPLKKKKKKGKKRKKK